jgi:methyl-accepting chemotaxis protein
MKNLKVATKLFVGFGIAIAFILTVGLVSVFSLNSLNDDYTKTIDSHGKPLGDAAHILESQQAIRAEMRLAVIYTGNLEMVAQVESDIDAWYKKFEESTASFGTHIVDPKVKSLFADALDNYQKTFKPAVFEILDGAKKGVSQDELVKLMLTKTLPASTHVSDNMNECIQTKREHLAESQKQGNDISKTIFAAMLILIIASIAICMFFAVYVSGLISTPVTRLSKLIEEWSRGRLDGRLNIRGRTDELGVMAAAADSWVDALYELITEDGGKVLKAAADKDLSLRLTGEYEGDYGVMRDNINAVVQNLDDALIQVQETVGHVSSASGQISGGAQCLAEGSSEQAASLEEVSASLEEMSSMTKQSADNSSQAKVLAGEARSAADDGDAAMKRMATAINQIKESADNTAKIIKTIDDIAFQTNLLALNAAVEAARAGEAGKGFAVVAEEVRNLAMRSAEAAKETASMIEQSVRNADGGVKITEEVAASLGRIVDRAGKVGNLIEEIAAASNEQAQGIEQVNTAVLKMNEVTQRNATNSEESASAAEELNSLAEELEDMVRAFKLSTMSVKRRPAVGRVKARLPAPAKKPVAALDDRRDAAAASAKSVKTLKPEDVIPLDDENFRDF